MQSASVTVRSRWRIASRIVPHRRRRVGIERVLLGLDRPPSRANGQPAKLWAMKRAHPTARAGGEQVVRALGPQAVGQRELFVHLAEVEVGRERGELVDDHLGLGLGHGLRYLVGVERVDDRGLRTELPDLTRAGLAARRADNGVAGGRQPRQ